MLVLHGASILVVGRGAAGLSPHGGPWERVKKTYADILRAAEGGDKAAIDMKKLIEQQPRLMGKI